MDLRVVIMAGGTGTRFWPLSRKKRPKQFLPIISHKTMIEETFNRLLPKIPPSHIYTIANQQQTQLLKKYLPTMLTENFLTEPQGKNTAPCLALATATICLQNPEAVIAVLPADHLIQQESLFLKKIWAGAQIARQGDYLITFGIPPTFPATGYGYIQFSQKKPMQISSEKFFSVREFKEKPDLKTAQSFLNAGNYFWNSGMFIWQARVFADKIKQYAPSLSAQWEKLLEAVSKNEEIAPIYAEMPAISIDYALMEKAKGVFMGEGNFGWSDVGVWSSLAEFWPHDKNRNVGRGESIILDSKNCLIYNPQKLTALVGVKDLIIVDTEDALLICHKDQDQRVKDIVAKIKQENKKEHL